MVRRSMRLALAVCAALLWAVPAGHAATVPPPGDYSRVIVSAGVQRHFILHIPVQYEGRKPLPLVFILHGFGGTAASMRTDTGMNDKADAEGFFVAYLDGTLCDPSLNAPPCNGPKQGFNSGLLPELGIEVDDVRFVRDVLSAVQEVVRVDVRRVYAAGFSNGGAMTHRLGADLADLLAGIAVVEGIIGRVNPNPPPDVLTIPEPVGPIPVAIVHGLNDATYPFNGGGGAVALPVADAVAFWAKANQCVGPIDSQIVSHPDLEITRYGGCMANSDVVFYVVEQGEHRWPRADDGLTGFSATDAIWAFFAKHPRT